VSGLREFTHGHFEEVLSDPVIAPDRATKVIFCTGKIYYELLAERENGHRRRRSGAPGTDVPRGPRNQIRMKSLALTRPRRKSSGARKSPRNMGAFLFCARQDAAMLEASRRILPTRGP